MTLSATEMNAIERRIIDAERRQRGAACRLNVVTMSFAEARALFDAAAAFPDALKRIECLECEIARRKSALLAREKYESEHQRL